MLGVPTTLFSFMLGTPLTDALSPTARSPDDAFSLPAKSVSGVLREKNEYSRSFSKVDEVGLYPYYLGEVEFWFLTYWKDPLDSSS